MATSADRDDRKKHDEHDEQDEHDEHDEGRETETREQDDADDVKAAPAKKPAAKADADTHDDDEEDDDEEEAPRPPKKTAPARGPGKGRGPGAARAKKAPPAQGGSLGKSVLLFFVIVIGLGAGFAILGREPPAEPKAKWNVGQTVDVEVTLVKSDRQDLACASSDEIAGKHCAFEAANKPWSKGGDNNDDKKVLKPYTTTDRLQFVAAGLWSDPGLAPDKLPATRFSAKCKLKVEGQMKNVGVRWNPTDQWYPQDGWYAGTISNCTLN